MRYNKKVSMMRNVITNHDVLNVDKTMLNLSSEKIPLDYGDLENGQKTKNSETHPQNNQMFCFT